MFKNDNEKTNLDAHVGKKLKVLSVNQDSTRAIVKLNDIEYTAVGMEDTEFTVGESVEVIKFEGNKIIVKKISKES